MGTVEGPQTREGLGDPDVGTGHSVWAWSVPVDEKLEDLLRQLALPRGVWMWSPRTLREKLIKIGAEVVRHAKAVTFQLAEVAVPRALFAAILGRIGRLRAAPSPG